MNEEQLDEKAAEVVKTSCFVNEVTNLKPLKALPINKRRWLGSHLSGWPYSVNDFSMVRLFATKQEDRWVMVKVSLIKSPEQCEVALLSSYTEEHYNELQEFSRLKTRFGKTIKANLSLGENIP